MTLLHLHSTRSASVYEMSYIICYIYPKSTPLQKPILCTISLCLHHLLSCFFLLPCQCVLQVFHTIHAFIIILPSIIPMFSSPSPVQTHLFSYCPFEMDGTPYCRLETDSMALPFCCRNSLLFHTRVHMYLLSPFVFS